MLNLDPGKLLVIAVVAIILLGPDRLPQVARQVGGAWRAFNEFRHRMESEVRSTMPDLPPTSEIARLARSPSALLNHLSNMSTDEAPDGSFQPPSLTNGNAHRNGDAADDAAEAPDAAASAAPDVAPAAARTELPAPVPDEPTPSPRPPDRRVTAPGPSAVVVPVDPTLN